MAASLPPLAAPRLSSIIALTTLVCRLRDGFRRRLAGARAQYCIVEDWFQPDGFALCAACRDLGIVPVDVQHGLQGDDHPAYGRWLRVPAGGYEVMPRGFLCWDEPSARAIRSWADLAGCHAHVIGHPWLERWLRDDPELTRSFDAEIRRLGLGTRNVLVSFQPREFEATMALVLNAARTLPPEWKWWLRLHPGQLRSRSPVQVEAALPLPPNVVIEPASRLSLHGLLRYVDHHVTPFSSVAIEAARFGVPTSLTSPMARDYYADLVDRGAARVCVTLPELTEHLLASQKSPPERTYAPKVLDVLRRMQ